MNRPLEIAVHILVIDDEPAITEVISEFCCDEGFVPVIANTPEKGIEILHAAPRGTFSAVLCDMSMPHLNGADVADALWEIDARIPVLLMTGRMSDVARVKRSCPNVVACIAKPFRRVDLMGQLQDVICRSTHA